MGELAVNLSDILSHGWIDTARFIPSIIVRLAMTQKARQWGERTVTVSFCESIDLEPETLAVTIRWNVADLDEAVGYNRFRDELRKLRNSQAEQDITELAALGIAFSLVRILLPTDEITKVVPLGGRGDYYLNGRRDEMIEMSGTLKGDLNARFFEKRAQILKNNRLIRAFVCVVRFDSAEARLERVR